MENNKVESNEIRAIYDLYNLGFSTAEISQMINGTSIYKIVEDKCIDLAEKNEKDIFDGIDLINVLHSKENIQEAIINPIKSLNEKEITANIINIIENIDEIQEKHVKDLENMQDKLKLPVIDSRKEVYSLSKYKNFDKSYDENLIDEDLWEELNDC